MFSQYYSLRTHTHTHPLPVSQLRADEEDLSRIWTGVSRTKWEGWVKRVGGGEVGADWVGEWEEGA